MFVMKEEKAAGKVLNEKTLGLPVRHFSSGAHQITQPIRKVGPATVESIQRVLLENCDLSMGPDSVLRHSNVLCGGFEPLEPVIVVVSVCNAIWVIICLAGSTVGDYKVCLDPV